MILELDCGNSFIKWRVIHVADAVIEGGGIVDSDQALLQTVREQAVPLRRHRDRHQPVGGAQHQPTQQHRSQVVAVAAATVAAALPSDRSPAIILKR